MIKAAIFDLDGTILDTLSTIAFFGNSALKRCGFPEIDENEYRYFAGNGRAVLIERMLKHLGADTLGNRLSVTKVYDSLYEADTKGRTKPFDGIEAAIAQLRRKGIKTAVLSNKPDNVAVSVVGSIFPSLFDTVHGGSDKFPLKPVPDGALITAAELGAKPCECVFVGDTAVDIETAQNAAMKSVGVLWGFREENELRCAGADRIIASPAQLVDAILKIENEKTREK